MGETARLQKHVPNIFHLILNIRRHYIFYDRRKNNSSLFEFGLTEQRFKSLKIRSQTNFVLTYILTLLLFLLFVLPK